MASNMIYIVAFGVGFKCPRKIHLNTSDFGRSINPITTRGVWADYASYGPDQGGDGLGAPGWVRVH